MLDGALRRNDGVARQMKMRACNSLSPGAAGVTAEGDGFTLLVATIRVAAVDPLKLDQREVAWGDIDAAKFNRFDFAHAGLRGRNSGKIMPAGLVLSQSGSGGSGLSSPFAEHALEHRLLRLLLVGVPQPHPLGASERGVPRVVGAEFRR